MKSTIKKSNRTLASGKLQAKWNQRVGGAGKQMTGKASRRTASG
jgi:hypothetical protein